MTAALTAAQWRRVRDLFEAALDQGPGEAAEWLAREAADDPLVRAEAVSLLQHHSRAGEFLVQSIAGQLPELLEDDRALTGGTTIGSYTIVRELGRGGMGRVYLAHDARLNRTVALKALAPHLLRDPFQRERLRREARAAAALAHPGICTVFALEEIEGDLFIATEFIDGRTLGEEMRAGHRPSAAEIRRTARELSAALAAAHAAGIVHRDLKPDNVMRAVDGRLKILDFGLAQSQRPEDAAATLRFATRPGVLIGTPGYIAPEQLAGERGDARADVYAFGVLIAEYALGSHPFVSGAPKMQGDLGAVVDRCLRQAPDERYATAGEILAALDATADNIPRRSTFWWRAHQLVILSLYAVATAAAWQIKTWIETPVTVAIFIALGAAATVGGVFRGHVVFTERMNSANLAGERRTALRVTALVDLLFSALLLIDGVIVARLRALPALMTVSLAIGIAMAALVLEPATTRAAFGDDVSNSERRT